MNGFKKFFTFCIALFCLASCKQIKIQNGEIPDEYLDVARIYARVYHGAFQGNRGDLKLSLNGKKLVAQFSGQTDDLTGNSKCQSQIGNLEVLQLSDDGKSFEGASFDFDSNLCPSVIGKSFDLAFIEKDSKIQVASSILQEIVPVRVCNQTPTGPKCGNEYNYIYLSGIFQTP